MRWAVFLSAAVLALIWDTGGSEILRLEKLWEVRPSVVAVLAVFLALSAPRLAAIWSCLVLGLLLDLSNQLTTQANQVAYLIGPYTLGYTAGAWLMVRGRTMVFRRRPLTVGVMTVVYLLVVHLVAVTVLAVRSTDWYPGGSLYWTDYATGVEVLRAVLVAIYSGLFAVPIGWLLIRSMPAWGFQTSHHRSPALR